MMNNGRYDPNVEPYAELKHDIPLDDQQLEARRALTNAHGVIEWVIEERPEIMGISVMIAYMDPGRVTDDGEAPMATYIAECGNRDIVTQHHLRMSLMAASLDPDALSPME